MAALPPRERNPKILFRAGAMHPVTARKAALSVRQSLALQHAEQSRLQCLHRRLCCFEFVTAQLFFNKTFLFLQDSPRNFVAVFFSAAENGAIGFQTSRHRKKRSGSRSIEVALSTRLPSQCANLRRAHAAQPVPKVMRNKGLTSSAFFYWNAVPALRGPLLFIGARHPPPRLRRPRGPLAAGCGRCRRWLCDVRRSRRTSLHRRRAAGAARRWNRLPL